MTLQLLFQANGLFYNRGSVFFDGEEILDYPNAFLAEILAENPDDETRDYLALDEATLKRDLLFFLTGENYQMSAFVHSFQPDESYLEGIRRLKNHFVQNRIRYALAASPPLILPGPEGDPVYLDLPESLGRFHANDVRHTLYCPYEQSVLLSAELGRMQSLHPRDLARVLGPNSPDAMVRFPLKETLSIIPPSELCAILEKKGFGGRFRFETEFSPENEKEIPYLWLAPLEGIYNHLIIILTRQGRFGFIQTSGARGNITGNDGPTYRQLIEILCDLNSQPPLCEDPIIAAASGSQGNDVANVICRDRTGKPGLLAQVCPLTALDNQFLPRGIVTTPRVGIVIPD